MKYYVYILQSLKDKKFYIGSTSDIDKRLSYHNKGKNRSTKYRAPFILVYLEEYTSKSEAMKREYYLKSPKGFLEKKGIIENLKNSRVAQPEGSPSGAVSTVLNKYFYEILCIYFTKLERQKVLHWFNI